MFPATSIAPAPARAALLLTALLAAGCAVGPDYAPPESIAPNTWTATGDHTPATGLAAWWTTLG